MTSTKLTLLVDKSVVARAKRYSKRHRTSVSRLVSQIFERLPDDDGDLGLTPGVRRLVGVLPKGASLEEHRRQLRKKISAVRLFLDANVLLDVLTGREPHWRASARVLASVEAGRDTGLVAAHSVTTIYYLLSKHLNRRRARAAVVYLLRLVQAAPVDHRCCYRRCRWAGTISRMPYRPQLR